MSVSGRIRQAVRHSVICGIRALGIDRSSFAKLGHNYIRTVNYHGTPAPHAKAFEQQLQYFKEHFHPATKMDLQMLLQDGHWPYEKPGILLSFDDGMRTNYDVGAALLEQYGFQGWFFVMPEFVDCPAAAQADFASSHAMRPSGEYADNRYAMNRQELLDLRKRGHIIGCHTLSHMRMSADLDEEEMTRQIVIAKQKLAAILNEDVDTFCWVGGEEENYHPTAQKIINKSEFRYSFLTNSAPIRPIDNPLGLQRTNLGTDWPIADVSVSLSGLIDLKYRGKRLRVNRKLFAGGR